jgi:hypothetical protein
MLTFDPLSEAHERARQFQAEATTERLHLPTTRHLLAEAFRRTANRLDPAAVAVRLAGSQR